MSKKMIRLIVASLIACLVASMAFASIASLSQPIKIGELRTRDGFNFSSWAALPSSKENAFYDFGRNNIVRFYLTKGDVLFGSPENINKTVSIRLLGPINIYEVLMDKPESYPFYILQSQASDGGINVDVVSKAANGNYIRHLGEEDFDRMFGGDERYSFAGSLGTRCDIQVSNDTIFLKCGISYNSANNWVNKSWVYALKWDDSLQKFKVTYQD